MNSPAEIRPGGPDDVDALVQILWDVGIEGRWIGTEVPFDRDERRRRIAERMGIEAQGWFVVDAGGAVVGSIGLQVAPYGVADLGMALLDGWRGQGFGTALMAAGIEWAQSAGAHKLALEVWPHNVAGLALYRKMGFVEEGRKVRHYRRRNGELWDAVLMGLPLP